MTQTAITSARLLKFGRKQKLSIAPDKANHAKTCENLKERDRKSTRLNSSHP
jgi:hypothetical protein